MPYYAVAIGRKPGVYNTWDECKVQVDKFVRSRYKKFDTYEQALLFIEEHSTNIPAIKTSKRKFSDETDSIVKKIKRIESEDVQKIIEVDSATDIVKIKDGIALNYTECGSAVIIYTDGACSSNGRAHAKAGVGVYFGDNHPDNISEPLLTGPHTNNRAEYQAVVRALEVSRMRDHKKVQIRTDSNLLVRSMNEWMPKWKKNGWKTMQKQNVKNRDLLEKIDKLRAFISVEFVHVRGHAGLHGNEKADRLARLGASKRY